MTAFKMETIFKLNLKDQVCSDLTTQGALENTAAGLRLMGRGEALLPARIPMWESAFPFIPYEL